MERILNEVHKMVMPQDRMPEDPQTHGEMSSSPGTSVKGRTKATVTGHPRSQR